jgi:predicted metal-dependent phosphoesterase TrpH
VDRTRDGVHPLSSPTSQYIDLHLHSTASDGTLSPRVVVERARAAKLAAIALTDHDTLAGLAEARETGTRLGLQVVSGCEFSVAATWGELHVLGYFLPSESEEIEVFLAERRNDRYRRAGGMVSRLHGLGITIEFDQVLEAAAGGAIGRPHVAQVLVDRGAVRHVQDAFDRYLGRGRPAFVEKDLPSFRDVADLVHRVGGLVSAAHIKDRGTRRTLRRLRDEGLDAVEIRHPSHTPDIRAVLTEHAAALGLLPTGGSDWHGDTGPEPSLTSIGTQEVPPEWLTQLERRREERAAER